MSLLNTSRIPKPCTTAHGSRPAGWTVLNSSSRTGGFKPVQLVSYATATKEVRHVAKASVAVAPNAVKVDEFDLNARCVRVCVCACQYLQWILCSNHRNHSLTRHFTVNQTSNSFILILHVVNLWTYSQAPSRPTALSNCIGCGWLYGQVCTGNTFVHCLSNPVTHNVLLSPF